MKSPIIIIAILIIVAGIAYGIYQYNESNRPDEPPEFNPDTDFNPDSGYPNEHPLPPLPDSSPTDIDDILDQIENPPNNPDTDPNPNTGENPLNPDLTYVSSHCSINYAETAETTHFKLHEFKSKDSTKDPSKSDVPVPKALRGNLQQLMNILEIIRAAAGSKSITIISGWRSPSHNRNVGGATRSRHLCAVAADLRHSTLSPDEFADLLENLIRTGQIPDGGIGRYNTFTHYDIGGAGRRWDYRTKSGEKAPTIQGITARIYAAIT